MTNRSRLGSFLPGEAIRALCLVPLLTACTGGIGAGGDDREDVIDGQPSPDPNDEDVAPPPPPSFEPPPPALRRLTQMEFANAIQDLLGLSLPENGQLQPDSVVARYASVGASTTGFSESGVEKAEELSRTLLDGVFADANKRMRFVGCEPAQSACLQNFITAFGRRAWRRPLTETERDRYVNLAREIGILLGDPWKGLALSTSGLLQSPNFLYRAEMGESQSSPENLVAYTPFDLAARLSFLLWATTPDDELLDAAARGDFSDAATWQVQAKRLLDSPRAKTAAAKFFRELMGVDGSVLEKDKTVFTKATPSLWRSMREEVERLMLDAAFGPEADIRKAFRSRAAYADAELASVYGLKLDGATGMQSLEHDQDGPRVGVLTSAGFLAQHGIADRGSPVLRGLFVRETLLCAHIPEPPEAVDLVLKPSENAKTTRQKLEQHATDPSCSGCHEQMDELGFAFENFDGLGMHRLTENGAPVDTSGHLDGKRFDDAKALVDLLLEHEDFERCLVTQLYRFATGRMENDGDTTVIDNLTDSLRKGGYAWQPLLVALTASPGFRFAGKPL